QSVLIDAACRLKAAGRLARWAVILAGDAQGRDGYVRMLQSQIEASGLSPQIRLVGHIEDMAAAYLAAHVSVVASTKPEAFGRTAIEAAAMGCPVVATDLGAPRETILAAPAVAQEATTGWLVRAGDGEALAHSLAEALSLAEEARAAMGVRARQHVLAHYTVDAMQRRTLAVYDRLLGTVLERRFSALVHAGAPPALS